MALIDYMDFMCQKAFFFGNILLDSPNVILSLLHPLSEKDIKEPYCHHSQVWNAFDPCSPPLCELSCNYFTPADGSGAWMLLRKENLQEKRPNLLRLNLQSYLDVSVVSNLTLLR